MKNTLMIDIETTGTKPGCKVLSIGAFGFSKNGGQVQFYEKISPTKSASMCLKDEEETMEWWGRQDESTKIEAFSGTKSPMDVIAEFTIFFNKNFSTINGDELEVWCNGSDFDFPILNEFFSVNGRKLPWEFYHQEDYRTIKKEHPSVKVYEKNTGKHNALEDAKAQMRGLRHYKNEIKTRL